MKIDEFATQHRLRIQTDPQDATTIIPGRKGLSHVFEYGEGLLGVMVMLNARAAHRWNAARSAFAESGMSVRQDGDQEGVTAFDPENWEQVRLALKYAEVNRKRRVSEKDRQRLVAVGLTPPGSVPPGSQNESGPTAETEKPG